MPSQPTSRSPGRPPAADTAARILDAAEALFAEAGFAAASMEAIASRAGVSKANLFHHFGSKRGLYLAVVRRACAGLPPLLQAADAGTAPVAERVRTFVAGQLDDLYAHTNVTALVLRELLGDAHGLGQGLAREAFGEHFARLVGILRGAQAQGGLRTGLDPAMLATVLVGANVFLFQTASMLEHFPDVDFAQDRARYVDKLMAVLGPLFAGEGTAADDGDGR